MLGLLGGGTVRVHHALPWGHTPGVEARFAALAGRFAVRAARAPRAYEVQVALAAMLGRSVVLGALAIVAGSFLIALAFTVALAIVSAQRGGLSAAILWLFVILAIWGKIAWSFVAAVWIREARPVGQTITRDGAPALFAALDGIRAAMAAPQIGEVLITDMFNASIVQRPRLGPLGWHRNTLLIGLPLMHALAPDQLRAVIAHELGHLAGAHGKLGGRVYRVRETWARLEQRLPSGLASWGLRRFFGWYGPWFNALSFALARQQEYDADRAAARVTATRIAADALTRVEVESQAFQECYWDRVVAQADTLDQPAPMPMRGAPAFFRMRVADDLPALAFALSDHTGMADTHPCLADRLAALGEPPRLPARPDTDAAEYFLGAATADIADALDREWWEFARDNWALRHTERTELADELAQLDARADALDPEEARRQAALTEELRGPAAALQRYEALRIRDETDATVALAVARLLLATGDANGLPLVEAAIRLSSDLEGHACDIALTWARRYGDDTAVAHWRERFDAACARLEAADRASDELGRDEPLLPPAYDAGQRAELAEALAGDDALIGVLAARRHIAERGRDQQIVFLRVANGRDSGEAVGRMVALFERFGDVLVIASGGGTRWVGAAIARIPGGELLRR